MTPIPDNIRAAIDAYDVACNNDGFDNNVSCTRSDAARARLDALIGEVVAERDRLKVRVEAMPPYYCQNCGCDKCGNTQPTDALSMARAERDRLNRQIDIQRAAFTTGMDAAKQISSNQLEAARKLHAASNPNALDSERAMNATLTERSRGSEPPATARRPPDPV